MHDGLKFSAKVFLKSNVSLITFYYFTMDDTDSTCVLIVSNYYEIYSTKNFIVLGK
jgi:hypothetical protein